MTIPEGFRLGDGWREGRYAYPDGLVSRCDDCGAVADFNLFDEDGQVTDGVCAGAAIEIGALVPVAPVEAPTLDPHRYDGPVHDEPIGFTRRAWAALLDYANNLEMDPRRFVFESAMSAVDGVSCSIHELTNLRADLAAAEQRAAAAEDKLRRTGDIVGSGIAPRIAVAAIVGILREGM